MNKSDFLRVTHFQYFSVVVITLFTSYLLFPGRRRMDSSSVLIAMIHLGSFIAQYGAQLWVTIVAGLTMFYNLPRHMFGQVQSRLFPMFFLWSLVTSAICLATFVTLHPFELWDRSLLVQALCLCTGFISAAMNSLIIAPLIVNNMVATFEMEVKAGLKDAIGYADMSEMKKKNPEYAGRYKAFRRCHGLGSMATVCSLLANTVQLYYLASQCVAL